MEIAKSTKCIPGRRKFFPNSTFTSACPTSESIFGGLWRLQLIAEAQNRGFLTPGWPGTFFAASPFEY
jgi:hypothetical protein